MPYPRRCSLGLSTIGRLGETCRCRFGELVSDLDEVRRFERELDDDLRRRRLLTFEPVEAVTVCAKFLSFAQSDLEKHGIAVELKRGFDVALEHLIWSDAGVPFDENDPQVISTIVDDLIFMAHYNTLREYLYFTYNAPDSFEWDFSPGGVKVKFSDPSIPRQFEQTGNSYFLVGMLLHEQIGSAAEELRGLLRGHEEFGSGDHFDKAVNLAATEADAKLAVDFELFKDAQPPVALYGYSYSTFFAVFRYILMKALYHRAYARSNDTSAVFLFLREAFLNEIAQATGIERAGVEAVVRDLSYSRESGKLLPAYFSIYDHPKLQHYVMLPQNVVGSDGLVQLLRIQASIAPSWFSSNISGPLGRRFANRVCADFSSAGFYTKENISLTDLDPSAPDIDLLVVSREPTLGYVAFICEIKATLPAIWAKDHLRTLRKDSLPKAFDQMERIKRVLASDAGINFLLAQVRSCDPDPMPEFLIVLNFLIITPQNTGMFFGQNADDVPVVDHPTLSHILRRCDGDVAFLLNVLDSLPELFGSPEIAQVEVTVGERSVSYEAVEVKGVVEFAQNYWKSTGMDVEMAERFVRDGGSVFDVLAEFE